MLRFKLVTSQSWVFSVDIRWAEATLVRAQKVFNKILDRDGFSFSPDNERRVLICLSIATGTTLGIHRGRGLGCKWTSTLPRSGNPRTARCPVWTWTWGQSRRWSGSTSPNGVGLCSAHKSLKSSGKQCRLFLLKSIPGNGGACNSVLNLSQIKCMGDKNFHVQNWLE